MRKYNNIMQVLAVLCAGYGIFADGIFVPLISSILAEFPNDNQFLVNFIISGNSLVIIPFAILAGWLATKFSKKDILVVGFSLCLIGGIGGRFANSLEFLAIMRVISGAAEGLIGSTAIAIIPEIYTDIKERSKIMGWYNAASAVFGVAMTFLAGLLAVADWRNGFYANLLILISLALIIFFMPRTPAQSETKKETKKTKYPIKKMFGTLLQVFLISTLYTVIYFCISIYVDEKGLGNSALSGTLSSIGTIAGFVISAFFGKIYGKLKDSIPTIVFIVCGLCYIAMTYTNTVFTVFIAYTINSLSYSLSISYFPLNISVVSPQEHLGSSVSYYFATYNIGFYVAPFIPNLVQKIFGVQTFSGTFLYIGIALIVIGIVCLITNQRNKNINFIASKEIATNDQRRNQD